jgi:hypothetical protein
MNKNIIIILVFGMIVLLIGCTQYSQNQDVVGHGVHLHPKLTIIIDGDNFLLPDDIGVRTGKIIDTHLSGMKMSPTHTHESDGTIHIENNNPDSKPETLTLGYFFEVWDKTFSPECIFEYCINEGTLKMIVNGEENFEYGNYIMKDKDDILIEYITKEG